MRKIENWEQIKDTDEQGNSTRLEPGAYVCKILKVEDVEDKEYLKIAFDITEGEFKGYFKELFNNNTNADKVWSSGGILYRSYKKTAERFFASFITAIEKSNDGYKWNWDEQSLKNKTFVGNFREEEYISDGELKVSVKCHETRSTQALKDGNIKPLEIKRVSEEELRSYGLLDDKETKVSVQDDDLPF